MTLGDVIFDASLDIKRELEGYTGVSERARNGIEILLSFMKNIGDIVDEENGL